MKLLNRIIVLCLMTAVAGCGPSAANDSSIQEIKKAVPERAIKDSSFEFWKLNENTVTRRRYGYESLLGLGNPTNEDIENQATLENLRQPERYVEAHASLEALQTSVRTEYEQETSWLKERLAKARLDRDESQRILEKAATQVPPLGQQHMRALFANSGISESHIAYLADLEKQYAPYNFDLEDGMRKVFAKMAKVGGIAYDFNLENNKQLDRSEAYVFSKLEKALALKEMN